MAIQLVEQSGGKILEVHLSDKLTEADYQLLLPQFERLLREHGKLRVLLDLTRFTSGEVRPLREDLKIYGSLLSAIERIAMVGDQKWRDWLATVCAPLLTANIRYFDPAQAEEARAWIHSI
jgi:hypothetical protein